MRKVDVIVIGASLAGAACAATLARGGLQTEIFDKCGFPRSKACGDGLSGSGRAILADLGLGLDAWPDLYTSFNGYEISRGHACARVLEFRRSSGSGITRSRLDHLVVTELLRNRGIVIHTNARVTGVSRVGDCFEVCSDGLSLRAPQLVVASGMNAQFKHMTRLLSSSVRLADRYALTARLDTEADLHRVRINLRNDYQAYVTPIGSGLNLSVLAESLTIRKLRSALEDTPNVILNRVGIESNAEIVDIQGAGPFNNRRYSASVEGLFLVGDAAEVLDPCGGQGMTHALCSGVLAAREILRSRQSKDSSLSASAAYEKARLRAVRGMRTFTAMTFSLFQAQSGILDAVLDTRLPPLLHRYMTANPVQCS